MRIVRALILSPLVPFLGVAVVAIGMGYGSVSEIGQFVLIWAIVLYPLVIALALGGWFAGRRLGLSAPWHFAWGGLLAGLALSLGWFGPLQPAQGGSPLVPTIVFSALVGTIGTVTVVILRHLAVRERAV